MKCKRVQAQLSKQGDARLDAADSGALGTHVESCRACQAYLANMEALARALRSTAAPAVPDGLAERLASKALLSTASSWLPDFARLALPSALAGAALALVLFVLNAASPPAATELGSDVVELSMNYESLLGYNGVPLATKAPREEAQREEAQ